MGFFEDIWNIANAIQTLGREELLKKTKAQFDLVGTVITTAGPKVVQEIMATKIRSSFVEAEGLLSWLSVDANQREVLGMKRRLEEHVSSFRFEEFKELWATARQFVGLQARLALEQVFWVLGPPWRSLVTGFKAITFDEKVRGRRLKPFVLPDYVARTRDIRP